MASIPTPPYTEAELTAPQVPQGVTLDMGVFTNRQGLKLQTYRLQKDGVAPKGLIYLCHGYAAHTQFEWFLPPAPGQVHVAYEGSLLSRLVAEGFQVLALDHQSHGRSEGARGLRCFFESYDDLAVEAADWIEEVRTEATLADLPVFLGGVSMGGCTAVKMALLEPTRYRGLLLLAPMISLELVQQQTVFLFIKNSHLAPFASIVSSTLPALPIAVPARNTVHPEVQKELDDDPLTYTSNVRARVAEQFLTVTRALVGGGLQELDVPFLTMHSIRDTFTDPHGSECLLEQAKTTDKTRLKVGPGLDIDADMWHALPTEPGCELVIEASIKWLNERV